MSTNENLKQLSIAEQRATKLVADAREGTYNEKKKKKSRRRRFLIPDIFLFRTSETYSRGKEGSTGEIGAVQIRKGIRVQKYRIERMFFSSSSLFRFAITDTSFCQTQFLGGSEQKIKNDIAKATDVDIDAMKQEFETNKKSGVKLLVDIVQKVEYSVPQALKDIYRES